MATTTLEKDLKPAKRDSSGYFLFPEHWNFQQTTLSKFIKYRWTHSPPGPRIPTNVAELDAALPVFKPTFESKIPKDHARVTWLGHASVLLEIPIGDQGDRVTLLTDPVYSQRCSPYQWIGPKRYRPPPLQVHELPPIDVVLISHNHYDHLDDTTITKLNERFPNLKWFVPLENSMYLTPLGVPKENISEQNWWDTTKVTFRESGELNFSLVPVQHYSRRGLMDQNRALWGGWVVQGHGGSFFFAGDTAYCSTFKAIHHRFGKHSFSAIPIGAYEPRDLFGVQHCDPDEAVQIHKEVESLSSLGIHWGTWALTFEYYLEPKQRLADIMAKETECPKDSFYTLDHGASKFVKWVLDEPNDKLVLYINTEMSLVRWMKKVPAKRPARWLSSFAPEDLLPAKRNASGAFENPKHWDYKATGFTDVLKWRLTTKDPGPRVPKDPKELDSVLPVLKPDFSRSIPLDHARITWLGHASVLLEIPIDTRGNKVTILTDPVFSDRCSPLQWAGPKRYRPSPLQVQDLPPIDAVVLSHNHYDHLDDATISQLTARFPTLEWFIPLDNSQYITPLGVPSAHITEQNWWDATTISLQGQSFTFSLVPVMHWSRRHFLDTNKALWGGWVVQGLSGSFFFCGDTAYCSSFKAIAHRFGRQSISAIPIGAYGPKEVFGKQHCDVDEAIQIHHDVNSASSIAIHWGTWVLTGEFYLEPKEKLEQQAPSTFSCIDHGASKLFPWVLDK